MYLKGAKIDAIVNIDRIDIIKIIEYFNLYFSLLSIKKVTSTGPNNDASNIKNKKIINSVLNKYILKNRLYT